MILVGNILVLITVLRQSGIEISLSACILLPGQSLYTGVLHLFRMQVLKIMYSMCLYSFIKIITHLSVATVISSCKIVILLETNIKINAVTKATGKALLIF